MIKTNLFFDFTDFQYLGGGEGVVGVERRTPPVQVGEQGYVKSL